MSFTVNRVEMHGPTIEDAAGWEIAGLAETDPAAEIVRRERMRGRSPWPLARLDAKLWASVCPSASAI